MANDISCPAWSMAASKNPGLKYTYNVFSWLFEIVDSTEMQQI